MTFSSAKDLPLLRGFTPALAPSPRRRKAGTTGKTLETLVLASPGIVLTPHQQEARWLPTMGNRPARIIAKRGPCDFSGTLPGGRSLILDAKESDQVRRLNCQKDHLPDHQVKCLVEHGAAGAVAGVLALSQRRGRLYWLDWRLLVPERRRNSYPWDELYDVGPASQAVHWPLVLRAAAYVEASVLRPEVRP